MDLNDISQFLEGISSSWPGCYKRNESHGNVDNNNNNNDMRTATMILVMIIIMTINARATFTNYRLNC